MQQTVAALRRHLAAGNVAAGARLPAERELARLTGASRPTVREAIRHLVEAGVLESRRGSGTYVRPVDLGEVFAVRLLLEPVAAGLAAEQGDPAGEITALAGRLAGLIDDPDGFAAVDHALHRAVARLAANRVLDETLDRLTGLTELSREITASDSSNRAATRAQLLTLADAIRRRDPVRAERAMREHLEQVRDFLRGSGA